MGVAIGDYNHTGRPSIYVTDFADEYDALYRNNGDWEFDTSPTSQAVLLCFREGKGNVPADAIRPRPHAQ